jgi:hypothetical protein
VAAQPRRAVACPGEHEAAPRDRAATRPQRADAAAAVDHGLDPRARGRRAAEAPRELHELRRVGARDVVQRARRWAVAAAAAARAAEPDAPVAPVHEPRRAVRRAGAQGARQRLDPRARSGAARQDERRPAVDGLADEVAADDRDPGEVTGRAVARAGHEVAAVEARERARPPVDRGHGLAAADDAVRERGPDRAAEAPRVDVEHVHAPRPAGQRRPVLAGEVDLRIGDLGGGEPRRGLLGGGLAREAADARDVGDRHGQRAVRRVGVDLEDARVEPEPARLRRRLSGLGRREGEAGVDDERLPRARDAAHDVGEGDARRERADGAGLGERHGAEGQGRGRRGRGARERAHEGGEHGGERSAGHLGVRGAYPRR